jgi:hypothetical protein
VKCDENDVELRSEWVKCDEKDVEGGEVPEEKRMGNW